MNSLIAMGALTSFAAGLAGPLVPGLALDGAALEEPVMLLAFVLLGRTLEARARLRASGAQHALPGALRRGGLRWRRKAGHAARVCAARAHARGARAAEGVRRAARATWGAAPGSVRRQRGLSELQLRAAHACGIFARGPCPALPVPSGHDTHHVRMTSAHDQ